MKANLQPAKSPSNTGKHILTLWFYVKHLFLPFKSFWTCAENYYHTITLLKNMDFGMKLI